MLFLLLKQPFVWRGEQRIPAVEEEIKRMGRDVKNFVEAALELYLNGSVDQAYEVAAMDEKINHYFDSIRDLATEEIKKNPDAMLQGRDYFQVIAFLGSIGDLCQEYLWMGCLTLNR